MTLDPKFHNLQSLEIRIRRSTCSSLLFLILNPQPCLCDSRNMGYLHRCWSHSFITLHIGPTLQGAGSIRNIIDEPILISFRNGQETKCGRNPRVKGILPSNENLFSPVQRRALCLNCFSKKTFQTNFKMSCLFFSNFLNSCMFFCSCQNRMLHLILAYRENHLRIDAVAKED